jgi:methylthioribose-1-phosphate isomerase
MKAVDWIDGTVRFIDQTLLPAEERFVITNDIQVIAEAIRSLRIRGAPAIGVAAAFGLVLGLRSPDSPDGSSLALRFDRAARLLGSTRPTAVNLFNVLNRMRGVLQAVSGVGDREAIQQLEREARVIQAEDIEACHRIGELGAALLNAGTSVLTHCNAGALATAGDGTALSVVTTAHRQGKIRQVYVDETRPLFQGARLTSWELLRAGIEVVLITDSTAASVLREGRVQAVIVGADRIAANGDTANKVGTYPLAVLAQRHNVPMYVAAPVSTLDPHTLTGNDIPIEERDPSEVTQVAGIRIAPEGVRTYTPAFDVTPHELISAIITDRGVLRPPYDAGIAGVLRKP